MISLKRLIINPKSPDRALQQAYSEAEGALARIAHVNRLSRDIMDIKYYEADCGGTDNATIRISSKKGIVDVVNIDNSAVNLVFSLQNSEIIPDREKFYLQLTAYTTSSAVPVIFGLGFSGDIFQVRVFDAAAANDWGDFYFYYEIVKID